MLKLFAVLSFTTMALIGDPLFAAKKSKDLEKGGWDAVSQEEIEVVQPRIDPSAAAEFLYRKIDVDDSGGITQYRYHNRAKIFSEAALEEWDKIDLIYYEGSKIFGIKARIIYPDGSVSYLEKEDIYKRQIYKDDKFEGYAKSFSFPGLAVGCIVEYKWMMSRRYWSRGFDLPIRAEWPTWEFALTAKPYAPMASRIASYNNSFPVDYKGGRYRIHVRNQPAISKESFLPPRKDFEPFVNMAYAWDLDALRGPDYWAYRGGYVVNVNEDAIRSKKKAIKKLAEQLTAGVVRPSEKLRAIYDYCADEITNISFYTDKFTQAELEELKVNDNPMMTIKSGYGTRYNINSVFASLASQLGYKASMANVENRNECTYSKNLLGQFNLSDWIVAVRVGKDVKYYDPGSSFLPFEELNPENCGASVIVVEGKMYYILDTPPSDSDDAKTVRVGTFTVNEFGDLEGQANILYSGHASLWRKRLFVSMSDQEIEEYVLENEWKTRLPRTALTDLKVKYLDERNGKLRIEYKVKIPGYANVLMDQLILNPCVFEAGMTPVFVDEKREEGVFFNYLYRVEDQVTIEVPDGYSVKSTGTVTTKFDNDLMVRQSRANYDIDTNVATYNRTCRIKLKNVGSKWYHVVKSIFEDQSAADSRELSFVKE